MDIFWLIFLLAIGACVGSFLNVVIYRLPRGESIAFPGSHCPTCGRAIKWYDNIPLISWMALRARCRWCKARISPRYILIEALTVLLVGGLYAWYYLFRFRGGAGDFTDTWPMFVAHAALLCGLLACSAVDIEQWIVPLEVCWVVSLVGMASAAVEPHPFLPKVSATTGGVALAAVVGLAIAMVLRHYGLIRPSFLDADNKAGAPKAVADSGIKDAHRKTKKRDKITSVAITKAHGVNPRKEILLEVVFIGPAVVLAAVAYLLLTRWPDARDAWQGLAGQEGGALAVHVNSFLSALLGWLVGGAWIWGARILGTLAFGKEAMGMGDVDILASVGAVAGWIVPTVAFFAAPFFGLLWALYLLTRSNQRELPYGPWLAGASMLILLFYDELAVLLQPYIGIMSRLYY
jgi:leader peptidase (prepilin peptidase)/N-methyltransferase